MDWCVYFKNCWSPGISCTAVSHVITEWHPVSGSSTGGHVVDKKGQKRMTRLVQAECIVIQILTLYLEKLNSFSKWRRFNFKVYGISKWTACIYSRWMSYNSKRSCRCQLKMEAIIGTGSPKLDRTFLLTFQHNRMKWEGFLSELGVCFWYLQ